MVTMAKKAKKDKSVIVTPDQADVANVSNDNASDEDTKPRKKKKKNKNKTKDTTSDNVVMDISCDKTESVETPSKKQKLIKEEKVIDQVKTTDRKSSGSIVRSSKDRMKVNIKLYFFCLFK